jgi:molybdate transport system substrate-binding protein
MMAFSSKSLLKRLCSLFLVLWTGLSGNVQAQPLVAAASDLKFALEDIARQFRADTGQSVRLVFGSSGTFTTQILQGAPFEVFMSADAAFPRKLMQAGLVQGEPTQYAKGRLVLFVPKGGPVKADVALEDLGRALRDGRLKHLAIANPEHAPYGQRATQVLQAAGLWDLARSRLILGENVSQAASFASQGEAQAGLIAASLVATPPLSEAGSFALIPERMHEPLAQSMVLLKRATTGAQSFYRYLQAEQSRKTLLRYGFEVPR